MRWSLAGNTAGFGHKIHSDRPFWIADFNGDSRSEVLFYYPGDHNWWMATYSGTGLSWRGAGNSAGFGNLHDGRPIWTGRFSQSEKDEILFYFPGDDNWWLGAFDGAQMRWSLAGNTAGFGDLSDGRPFWISRLTQQNCDEIVFYFEGDGNWWLGKHDGQRIAWSSPANTGRAWSRCVVQRGQSIVGIVKGTGCGVLGEVDDGEGVLGIAHHSSGVGIVGRNIRGGNAGFFQGHVTVTGDLILSGADVAEEFAVSSEAGELEPGTVVVLDEQGRVCKTSRTYDSRVIGIVSGACDRKPALVLDRQDGNRLPLAVTGKSWCFADATLEPIRVGDLLTTSSFAGYSMRASDPISSFGAVIGKALTPLPSGIGKVLVLVGLC